MRHVLLSALVIVALFNMAIADARQDEPVLIGTTWAVSLDASGHVVDLAQTTQPKNVKPPLAEPLAKAIRGWTFESGRIDGKPVSTETTLDLTVKLESQADGYVIRVSEAKTGGGAVKRVPPRLPSGTTLGFVVVEAHYDEAGKVALAAVAPGSPSARRDVVDSFLNAVRQWKFQPERVGGHAIAGTVYLPICVWQESRSPSACGKWTPPGESDAIGDGAMFAAQPAAKLKSDVVGHLL